MVGEKKHILVVDDDPFLVRLNKRQFENSGYDVSVTTESADVLELLRKNPDTYHLLITDLIMPGLSGRALVQKVGIQSPDLPIIVLTGQFDRETEEELLSLGVKAVVGKPVFGNELVTVVGRVLAGK
jgi:CheY-like chemotaxis protein